MTGSQKQPDKVQKMFLSGIILSEEETYMSEYLGFNPTSKEDYYFISYNSDDSERLTGLLSLLNSSGVNLWYDYGLNYGDEKWRTQIGIKIENCQAMLLFVTKNMFSKPDTYVKTEYRIAKNKCKKKIYVIILESIDDSDVPYSMYDWWVDITDMQCLEAWKYSDATSVLKEIYRMLGKTITSPAERAFINNKELPVSIQAKNTDDICISNADDDSSVAVYRAAEMLIKLEDSYQNNPRHIFVFNELEQAYRDKSYTVRFTENMQNEGGISNCDIVQYFTFFESLYRAIKNGILTIEDVDDCFADRFFKFVHNPYIQENELYLVPSTYVNIFELYTIWKKYHLINLSSPSKIISFLKNEIPDYYLDKKTYTQDIWDIEKRNILERRFHFVNLSQHSSAEGYSEFVLKRLFPRELRNVIKLQNDIIEELEDDSLFVETTKQEYIESMLIDFCYGLYDKDTLVAVCIIVLNRETDRNLIMDFDSVISEKNQTQMSFIDCITFDTIQVSKEYRGFGIQKFFLSLAENLCYMLNSKCIMASVSPQNKYSKNNFMKFGYSVLTTKNINKGMYHNKERDIVIKYIKS